MEEEDEKLSGTVSNGDSGAYYVGERIKTIDNIIQECVNIYLVIVQQHPSQCMNRKKIYLFFPVLDQHFLCSRNWLNTIALQWETFLTNLSGSNHRAKPRCFKWVDYLMNYSDGSYAAHPKLKLM